LRLAYRSHNTPYMLLPFLMPAVLALADAADAATPVDYTLRPIFTGDALTALDVAVRFTGEADGSTAFGWVDHWSGEERLWQWIRDLRFEGARSAVDRGEGHWRIEAAPGATITAHYRIVSAYDHDPTVNDSEQAKPVIRPGWFYAVGEALFASPLDHSDAPAHFRWEGAPAGFDFASDLQHLGDGKHEASRPGTVSDALESIAIGGRDLHIATDPASQVRVASIGSYSFEPAALDDLAMHVIEVERHFWDDRPSPFLVAAIPLVSMPQRLSYGGAGRGDAFALWIDRTAPLDAMKWLLAHEYFHSWNPAQLGGFADDDHAARARWFSEGFTDYYARALMVRSGMITPAEFVQQWNDMLIAYQTSPVKTLSGEETAARFWNDSAVQKLPYQRGAMLAALWNARLRGKTRGRVKLDDILHVQRRAARSSTADAAQLFPELASRYGLDVADDLTRFIDSGETIALPPDTFGPCATLTATPQPVFDRGFDSDATAKAGVVVGVAPGSAAYEAGLRNGMKPIAREGGRLGDSTVPYVLRVDDGGGERTIRYLPAGKGTVRMQRVVLEPGAGPECGATLGGLTQ
jgi:predicted metalloprotease with PDZ domain